MTTQLHSYKTNSALLKDNSNQEHEGYNEVGIKTNNKINSYHNELTNNFLAQHNAFRKLYNCESKEFGFILEKDLTEILLNAPSIISKHFNNFILTLSLNDETIFLTITSPASTKEAFKQMKNLFKDWDLIKNRSYNKYITIVTETV